MFKTNTFDYVNVLTKAADASAMRQEIISNNIANQDTPEYKRQDINFEGQLRQALKHTKSKSIDQKVSEVNMRRLDPKVYTDYAQYSYRLDGNNVDPEQEQVYLAKNQITYQGLMNSLTSEFANLKAVSK